MQTIPLLIIVRAHFWKLCWTWRYYCFCYKTFKACASKCHLFLSSFHENSVNTKSSLIEGSSSEKPISITIDNSNFIFENINISFLAKTV